MASLSLFGHCRIEREKRWLGGWFGLGEDRECDPGQQEKGSDATHEALRVANQPPEVSRRGRTR